MLKRLGELLALTNAERNVILFLVGTFLAGLAIRLYQETFPSLPAFDYRSSDSTFAALSAAAEPAGEADQSHNDSKIDINSASKTELMKLPGIGEVLAGRILAHRSERGPFQSIDDLRRVKGISQKKFEQIKNLIIVRESI
ncbi:MAG: helix-hairpin-helix domain-containing protein [Ignavibacteriales bacterium]|nr:helix-hairpin-helix domain-containing protein [Ignavibacteriales bacterium]